jgi:MinD superfamily P-loop ATPase
MKELVVISGKGGTGKTSIVASFAVLADRCVLADCDVDASDLHLVLSPTILQKEPFSGGSVARVVPDGCTACGTCETVCRFQAVLPGTPYRIDPIACDGCGVCAHFCPEKTIDFSLEINGEWYISDTRCGPMVHARLGIAQENSGKLVSLVRTQAKRIAQERGMKWLLIDGSPGIGCPVIASITGADRILAVTEPTLSGMHDLDRVAQLARHFSVETFVCVNKWNLNESLARQIEDKAAQWNFTIAGRVRYDPAVTEAMVQGKSIVEYTDQGAADDIRRMWKQLSH